MSTFPFPQPAGQQAPAPAQPIQPGQAPMAPMQMAPIPMAPMQMAPMQTQPMQTQPMAPMMMGGASMGSMTPPAPAHGGNQRADNSLDLATFDPSTMAADVIDENSSMADRPTPVYPGDYRIRVTIDPQMATYVLPSQPTITRHGAWKKTTPDKPGEAVQQFISLRYIAEIVDGPFAGRKRTVFLNTLMRNGTSHVDDMIKAICKQKYAGANALQRADFLNSKVSEGPTIWGRVDWITQTVTGEGEERETLLRGVERYEQDSTGNPIPLNGLFDKLMKPVGAPAFKVKVPCQTNWDIVAWITDEQHNAHVAMTKPSGGVAGLAGGLPPGMAGMQMGIAPTMQAPGMAPAFNAGSPLMQGQPLQHAPTVQAGPAPAQAPQAMPWMPQGPPR